MVDVDRLMSHGTHLEGVRVERSVHEEPARTALLIPGSDDPPRIPGATTTVSLLDVTHPGYSLRNGYLTDPDLRLVGETKVARVFHSMRAAMVPLEKPVHVRGTVALLSTARNYGHWLLLALPLVARYRALLSHDPDYYYVGSGPSQLQVESLELLGIPRERVLGHAVRADRLLAVIPDRADGYDSDFLLFADTALRRDATNAVAPRRIFVSRSGASHRRLVNEHRCASALRTDFGVELIQTEGMSLDEEIDLFRSAELIVGAHGAGLTNIAFAPEGARVVELVSSTYWDSIFAQLAAAKRQRYALIRGRSTGIRRGVPAARHDFEIDVTRLVDVVGAALESGGPGGPTPR
jgi:capsular polysaccharide biosynthesis protein